MAKMTSPHRSRKPTSTGSVVTPANFGQAEAMREINAVSTFDARLTRLENNIFDRFNATPSPKDSGITILAYGAGGSGAAKNTNAASSAPTIDAVFSVILDKLGLLDKNNVLLDQVASRVTDKSVNTVPASGTGTISDAHSPPTPYAIIHKLLEIDKRLSSILSMQNQNLTFLNEILLPA